ncbi:MAG: hypothetical protein HY777_03540 [Betaproteobacteria bacterium]|nr:hypothetical protein [Betaproteobacteria bacterium]
MKKSMLNDRYPVMVLELKKPDCICRTVEEVGDYFRARIAENPKVQFIGVFDHFAHTRKIGGEIDPGICAAVDIVFCFGFALPNPQILALRPRSIGVADMGDRFVVSFMEAPMQPANVAMESWSLGLRKIPAPIVGRQ